MVGVVGAGFDPTGGAEANESSQGWVLGTTFGRLWHAGGESDWDGQPRDQTKQGDVVVWLPLPLPACHAARLTLLCPPQGLLLDCDAATLTVWVNGERKGVMARPG
eukprot:COSAG04_NODE_24704_length_318_cov_0.666667_1_plen_105_part_11